MSYTFQLGDSGVVLNDDSTMTNPFVDINRVSGLDNAPYRETKRDHEGTDGGFMDAEFEQGRDIVLEGVVYSNGNAMETYLDTLKYNWAPSSSLIPLYVTSDVDTRRVFVKPLGCKYDWEQIRRIGCANVQFLAYAEDPRLYSNFDNTVGPLDVNATVFTGFGFNLSFDFGFGGVGTTTDGFQLTNIGNRPTPVIFTINDAVTNPQIICDTTSSTLLFDLTMISGDSLVIDTQYRTVELNGSNRRSKLTTNQWFYLQPGDNFVRFRAEAGTGTLTAVYRAAWR